MTTKLSISFTDLHAEQIEKAVRSGQYASASEVVRDALRTWLREEAIDDAIDEGIASGFAEPDEQVSFIIKDARKLRAAKKK